MIWWITGVCLITLGITGVIGNWVGVINAAKANDGHGVSMVPVVFGALLFFGVLSLPVEFGMNRYLAAYLAMSLDVMMPIGIGFWIMVLIRLISIAWRRMSST